MKRRRFVKLLGIGFILGGLFRGQDVKEIHIDEPKDEGGYLVPPEYQEEVIRLSKNPKEVSSMHVRFTEDKPVFRYVWK